MSTHEYLLLVDDDSAITTALSMLLERPGRTTIVCSDVESAEIAMAHFPITHLIADVQFSGMFGFEGLHFIGRARTRFPRCTVVLMTGHATDGLRTEAIRNGANELLAKPFEVEELEAALQSSNENDGKPYEVVRVPAFDEIVGSLETAFQPILELRGNSFVPFGFEALARVHGSWPIGGADTLFAYAARCDRLTELNLAAVRRAIESAATLPSDSAIFINVDPSAFTGGELIRILRSSAERAGISLSRIVLEITERSAFADPDAVMPLLDELRAAGVRFALDDHGSAYSHLSIVSRLHPSFVKISQTFGTGLELDETRQRIVAHVAALGRDLGCKAILEGIETPATAKTAAMLGMDFVQGYHFGRPNGAAHWKSQAA